MDIVNLLVLRLAASTVVVAAQEDVVHTLFTVLPECLNHVVFRQTEVVVSKDVPNTVDILADESVVKLDVEA